MGNILNQLWPQVFLWSAVQKSCLIFSSKLVYLNTLLFCIGVSVFYTILPQYLFKCLNSMFWNMLCLMPNTCCQRHHAVDNVIVWGKPPVVETCYNVLKNMDIESNLLTKWNIWCSLYLITYHSRPRTLMSRCIHFNYHLLSIKWASR